MGSLGLTAMDGDAVRDEQVPLVGWLPIAIDLRVYAEHVTWLFFGREPLAEPMFADSVSRLKRRVNGVPIKITGLPSLATFNSPLLPTGFVFHVSKCGSTLLANALKAFRGTVVVSEAPAFAPLLAPSEASRNSSCTHWGCTREDLLSGALAAFRQPRIGDETGCVLKFSSWQILSLSLLRRLWPNVPCLVVVRDPVEVMVSCLRNPPGWLTFKNNPRFASHVFGWAPEDVESMSDETFCARGIDAFLRAAIEHVSPSCRVVDYEDLTEALVIRIARFFGLECAHTELQYLSRCFQIDSKDPRQEREFCDDRAFKRTIATATIYDEARRWSTGSYRTLKGQQQLVNASIL